MKRKYSFVLLAVFLLLGVMGGASWAASITIGGSADIAQSVDYADTIAIDFTVAGTGFDADSDVTFTLDNNRWTISEDVKAVISADASGEVYHAFSLQGPGQIEPLTLTLTATDSNNHSATLRKIPFSETSLELFLRICLSTGRHTSISRQAISSRTSG